MNLCKMLYFLHMFKWYYYCFLNFQIISDLQISQSYFISSSWDIPDLDFWPKTLKTSNGHNRPVFEPHTPKLLRIHSLLSCINDEKISMISHLVSNLAKISVSVPTIPWGVFDLVKKQLPILLDQTRETKVNYLCFST